MAVAVPFEVRVGVPALAGRRVLFSQSYGAEGEARFGAPYLAIHRAQLLDVLAARVPAGIVELGRRVERSPTRATRSRSRSRTARRESFDVLIGADGIHSVVREALLGAESPVFTGPRRLPRAGAG